MALDFRYRAKHWPWCEIPCSDWQIPLVSPSLTAADQSYGVFYHAADFTRMFTILWYCSVRINNMMGILQVFWHEGFTVGLGGDWGGGVDRFQAGWKCQLARPLMLSCICWMRHAQKTYLRTQLTLKNTGGGLCSSLFYAGIMCAASVTLSILRTLLCVQKETKSGIIGSEKHKFVSSGRSDLFAA